MVRCKQYFTNLLSTLWFLPTLLILGSIGLAFGMIEFDRWQGDSLAKRWPRLIGTDTEGAREMLSVIAGSMITVAGVAFSITIVVLALAASQYSSRVLRNFMRNTSNQVVLGSLAGIFAYCLVVLRNVTGGADNGFLPGLAVAVGFVLALLGVFFLIYFLHHVASSIQASNMASEIASETFEVIHRVFPGAALAENQPSETAITETESWTAVPSERDGYVQRIDKRALVRFACEKELTIDIRAGVGDFVVKECPIVTVSRPFSDPDQCHRRINRCFALGPARTLDQDPLFGIRQLVDIAVKALSPGVNDPTTATACINYIGAILCRVASSELESTTVWKDGHLRLTGGTCDFEKFLSLAFEEIISCSRGQPNVLKHLMEAIERISAVADPEKRGSLLQHLDSIDQRIDSLEVATARDRLRRGASALRRSVASDQAETSGVLQTCDRTSRPHPSSRSSRRSF